MRILFHFGHPAHYHMYKFVIKNLKQIGHFVKITINTKDILEQLLIADGIEYENILPKRRSRNTKLKALLSFLKKDVKLCRIQLSGRYDMFIGTEPALAHVGWLFRKPVFLMVEDDAVLIPEAVRLSFPFVKYIVSPVTCDLGRWQSKKIEYQGFQKLAYLHPRYFVPDKNIVRNFLQDDERYFIVRLSALSAYHDIGNIGLADSIVKELISILCSKGRVLISSERKVSDELLDYCLNINITDIHHFLYYADLLIADSHSMCVEAAMLGTPSLRFSDYAGKVGILEELENKYGLTFGIPVSRQDKLIDKVRDLLKIPDLKQTWQEKREKMLEDKIDVTAFWTWLVNEYPKSAYIIKENPDYQKYHEFYCELTL